MAQTLVRLFSSQETDLLAPLVKVLKCSMRRQGTFTAVKIKKEKEERTRERKNKRKVVWNNGSRCLVFSHHRDSYTVHSQ